MNLVLITSALRPINDTTVFNFEQRLIQTLNTISTARKKIPNCYIVMIEGTEVSESEKNFFSKLVNYYYLTDVKDLKKSIGEATLLYRYLTSDHFLSHKFETVSKLSGRYYLNDNFIWSNLPKDRFIIKFEERSWYGRSCYHTRYYRIPKKYINNFISGLNHYLNSSEAANNWLDIEHNFYYHNIILAHEVYSPERLGICGLLTGCNKFVED
jgi:hypothetical protein